MAPAVALLRGVVKFVRLSYICKTPAREFTVVALKFDTDVPASRECCRYCYRA